MKILITGATGLIGSTLLQRLRQNHEVIPVSKSLGFDLRDSGLINDFINVSKPDIVYHLAANAAEARGQISPKDMTENNLNIFLNVLVPSINAKVKRFIYTSSVAVYGDCELPYSEDDIPKPKDVYGVNKLACEQILKILAKVHHFDYTILRPHNVYGERQDMSNPYKNVVALFMRSLIEGTGITIYGEGKMLRAFSYVDDVAYVMEQALGEKWRNQTVNIGSSMEIEVIKLLELTEKISGKEAKITYRPARDQEIYHFLASHVKQNHLLTYPETQLTEGLKNTWEYITLPKIKEMENEIQ